MAECCSKVLRSYIADLRPGAGLIAPAGRFERYETVAWLNFIATELAAPMGLLLAGNVVEETRRFAHRKLSAHFDRLDALLVQRAHAHGETFTVADAYLFTVLSWVDLVGLDRTDWPHLAAYLRRIAARPTVQAALQAEGLKEVA
jgi:glutathione S-transferase